MQRGRDNQGPPGRPEPEDNSVEFYIDNVRSRDVIRWAHNHILDFNRTFFQSLFFNVRRINEHSHLQLYVTERRQQQMLWVHINRNPAIITQLFNAATAVVQSDPDVNGHEIEFVNADGVMVANAVTCWEAPRDAFLPILGAQSLGAELQVVYIIKIEIVNNPLPNNVIMTVIIDYPPIY